MSETTQPRSIQPARPERHAEPKETYLGPAEVVDRGGKDLVVQLGDGRGDRVAVTTAFTFPYEPAVGDVLLVLGQHDRHFAVGVIAGRRPGALAFPGEARVHAGQGRLILSSDEAIELRAPRVSLRTGLLRTVADRVVEKSGEFRRWVRGALTLRAGNSRRLVDGLDSTRCENSVTLAKDTVTIDGDHLNLGH